MSEIKTYRWQTVRVFISSTFRDFHAEGDSLIKYVFQDLRQLMSKSGMVNKISQTLHHRCVIGVIILLVAVFVTARETTATSAQPSKTPFGWKYDYDLRGRIASITDPANRKTKIRYTQNSRGGLSGLKFLLNIPG